MAFYQNNIQLTEEALKQPGTLVKFTGFDPQVAHASHKEQMSKFQAQKKPEVTPNPAPTPQKATENAPEAPMQVITQSTSTPNKDQVHTSMPQYEISEVMLQLYEKYADKLVNANTKMIAMADTQSYLTNCDIEMEDLKKIVLLANPLKEKTITKNEYIIMLHLIYCKKKDGIPVPEHLPLELVKFMRVPPVIKNTSPTLAQSEIVTPQDTDILVDELKKKYLEIQSESHKSIESIRKNNNEILMKKNSD